MKQQLNDLTKQVKNKLRMLRLEMRGSDGLLVDLQMKTRPLSILWNPPAHDKKRKTLEDAENMLPEVVRVFEGIGLDPKVIKLRPVKDPHLPRRSRQEARLWNFIGYIDAGALRSLAGNIQLAEAA